MTQPAKLAPLTVAAPAAGFSRFPFAFAPRFFIAVVAGLAWLGPAWWDSRFAWLMLAWDLMVLVAWAIDFRRLPLPGNLQVSRSWLAPASHGVETEVEIAVANPTPRPLEAFIADDVPAPLTPRVPQVQVTLPALSSARATYRIHPAQRGDLRLGKTFLRVQSRLKLAERWYAAPLEQTVRVYPNLQEPKQHTLYLLRRQQVEQERRLKHQPGKGREFESLRAYREGDELRDVCWTATARRGKLVTRVYRTERSQPVVIIVDTGRLMLARIRRDGETLTKLDCAVNSALTLAQVAFSSGDRVGLLAYGRKMKSRLLPGRSPSHLRTILDHLAVLSGELVEANHAAAADALLSLKRQRSLAVWLTDLAETPATPEVIEAASRLLPQHLVLFVAIGQTELDTLLSEKPGDFEQMYRHVAAQEMAERREVLIRRLRERGALVLDLKPQQISTSVVNQYLMIKERGLL
jgi:uncharacterized protein (DUF58 family)